MKNLKVSIVGLDTSHAIQFARLMNDPECDPKAKVEELKVISCMRFETPFQSKEGLDGRQKQMEAWGIKVTENFEECVADSDAIMLEINDPAYHLEYFEKAAKLGKPIFLDKPMADTYQSGKAIYDLAKKNDVRVVSSSARRFTAGVAKAKEEIPNPEFASTYGTLNVAYTGSSVVWYGVHTMDMLQELMGPGAKSVKTIKDDKGLICIIRHKSGCRGIVELNNGSYMYGGMVRTKEKSHPFLTTGEAVYTIQLKELAKFFKGGKPPVSLEDTLEVMDLLDTAQRSLDSGKEEKLNGVY
jgi:predicted dehydrogenase